MTLHNTRYFFCYVVLGVTFVRIASFVDIYGKIEVVKSKVMGDTLFAGRQCLTLLPDNVMCRDESKREMAGCVCLMKKDLCATRLIRRTQTALTKDHMFVTVRV